MPPELFVIEVSEGEYIQDNMGSTTSNLPSAGYTDNRPDANNFAVVLEDVFGISSTVVKVFGQRLWYREKLDAVELYNYAMCIEDPKGDLLKIVSSVEQARILINDSIKLSNAAMERIKAAELGIEKMLKQRE